MTEVVKGVCHTTAVSFTRPANTTQYAAGDVICNAATLIFSNAVRGEGGVLQHAKIVTSNNASAKPTLELWLFDTTIAAVADNAAFAPTDAEMLTLIDVVPFAAADWKVGLSGAVTDGNATCAASNLGIPLARIPGGGGDIYGQLVDRTTAGYVPISAEAFQIRLRILD